MKNPARCLRAVPGFLMFVHHEIQPEGTDKKWPAFEKASHSQNKPANQSAANARKKPGWSIAGAAPAVGTIGCRSNQGNRFALHIGRHVGASHGGYDFVLIDTDFFDKSPGNTGIGGSASCLIIRRPSSHLRMVFGQQHFLAASQTESFGHLRAASIILVCGQAYHRQNGDDGENNHQFNESKAFLRHFQKSVFSKKHGHGGNEFGHTACVQMNACIFRAKSSRRKQSVLIACALKMCQLENFILQLKRVLLQHGLCLVRPCPCKESVGSSFASDLIAACALISGLCGRLVA